MRRIVGIALVVLGAVALIYGGVGYNRQRTLLDVGGIKATFTEHKTLPIAPVVGAISLLGGIGLLVVQRRAA